MGIAMEADPKLGETAGGLQAPHVVRAGDRYLMFYGDWENICLATSRDGKVFERRLGVAGTPALFSEGRGFNTRDAMAIRIGDLWHCYYTAYPERKGAVYCRTSKDLRSWSESKRVAFGGSAGTNPYSAECPHVVAREGYYYLFRTQRYGRDAQTSVYRSKDPLDFGIEDDKYLACTLPVAAPEIIRHGGRDYIACLLPSLKGIRIARLRWVAKPSRIPEHGRREVQTLRDGDGGGGDMAKKSIPDEVREEVEQIVARFNTKLSKRSQSSYVPRFKGQYLFLDRSDYGKIGPICRLRYEGKMDKWSFAIFKYSSETYSEDEFFPGQQHVDGSIEGAMKAGLEAYPA